MKIACDIDEVVVEWVRGYLKFANKRGLKKINYEDVFSFDLCDVFGVDEKVTYGLADEFYLTRDFDNIGLVDGALDGVKSIIKKHDFCFITARPKNISKKTRDFIFSNFRILGDKVMFSGDIYLKQGETKGNICKREGFDLIIEDNGKSSLDYAKNGVVILLLDKPWNKGISHDNIYRCYNWEDILNKVEELRDV